MSPPPVVVLIGLRGAGKTTLGKAIAKALERPFADLDDLALATCPESSIREVFQARGEDAWREAEACALATALAQQGHILAIGGGAPMVEDIAEALAEAQASGTACVFWLDAGDEVLAERIGPHGEARPPLLEDDAGTPLEALAECRALRERRAERYNQLSERKIDTSGEVADAVERILRETMLK
jgi:shikimate kinase